MKRWKRGLSLVLVMTMIMGLSSCGLFKKGDGSSDNSSGNNVNSELAKQYVFRMQEFDLSNVQEKGTDTYVQNVMESDGRLYMLLLSYKYTDGGTDQKYTLISMNKDGSDVKSCKLITGMNGEEGPSESESAESPAESETEEPEAEAEADGDFGIDYEVDVDVDFDVDYNYNVYESTNLSNFLIDGDRLWGTKTYYYEDYSNPENYVSIRRYYMCAWDLEGNMLWEKDMGLSEDENTWYNVTTIVSLGNGSAAALINGDISGKITVDAEGNLSELQAVEGLEKIWENYSSIAPMADGKLMIAYYGDDWSKLFVTTYDFMTDQISESYPLPASVANNMGRINLDSNGDLLYTNNMGVFKYHFGDENGTQVMSFINSDLDISYLNAIYSIDDDHLIGMYSKYDEENWNSTVTGGIFTRVPPEEIPDKIVLVLGGNYIGGDVQSRVIEYNKTSSTHRIVLRDYSQYAQADDYMAGVTQMNNDIISGKMPDILVVDSYSMSLDNYISKGLLADIGKLIDEDEELSQKEFMENVFEACSVDGKLYEVVPSFSVRTYIGKKSLLREPANWTMEEAQRIVGTMAEGATVFGEDTTRPYFFQTVMSMCGSDFIDVSTGKCNFDSPEFISLMEYAKKLPEQMPEDYYAGDWYASYESQYRENRTLLQSCNIYSLESLVYTINGTFGEDVSFVGFPNEGGQGAVINTYTTYALSAKSSDLDAAWNFVKYYLTDEYQETLRWDLPVDRKYFDEVAARATRKQTYEDADGNMVESDYTWWINDEEMILDPLTTKQVEEIKNYISSVTARSYYNEDIINIIDEEMDAFYQNQKSAKDVASIIQSRAQIFVNENR